MSVNSSESLNAQALHAVKVSQIQQELHNLQVEALHITRRLRADISSLFHHAQSGIQQTEQDSGSGINQKSAKEHFIEQLRANQLSLSRDFSELSKYLSLITSRAASFSGQVNPGQQVPNLLLSGKHGDDNQHAVVKIAG